MGGGDGAEGADTSAPAMVHSFQGWAKEKGVVGPNPSWCGVMEGGSFGRGLDRLLLGSASTIHII